MPDDIKLKVSADTTGYVSGISKMAGEHEKVNKIMREQGGLTDAVSHGLERSIFKSIALVHVLKDVKEALEESAKRAADLDNKLGSSRMKDASNLIGLVGADRVTGYQAMIEGGKGTASADQMSSFFAKLAGANRQRMDKHQPGLSQRTISTMASSYLYGGDLFYGEGGGDLMDILKTGGEEGLSANINAHLTKRFGLPAGTQDVQAAAWAKIPYNIRNQVHRDYVAKSAQFQRIMNEEGTGRGAMENRITSELELIKEDSTTAAVVDSMLKGPLTGWAYEPAMRQYLGQKIKQRDYEESVEKYHQDMQKQVQRKIIANDAHGDSR